MTEAKCRIVVPAKKDACGEKATYEVTWGDGDKTLACQDCAIHLSTLPSSYGIRVAPRQKP